MGRHPNHERRQQVFELRQQGLTLAEIGARFGVTRQWVSAMLQLQQAPPVPAVCCRQCKTVVIPAGATLRAVGRVLCVACAKKLSSPRFGPLLLAHRLAAGLSVRELSQRAGLSEKTLIQYERGQFEPKFRSLVKLVRVFGPGLVGFGREGTGNDGRERS